MLVLVFNSLYAFWGHLGGDSGNYVVLGIKARPATAKHVF